MKCITQVSEKAGFPVNKSTDFSAFWVNAVLLIILHSYIRCISSFIRAFFNISILNLTKPLWVSSTCFKIRKCFVTVSVTTQIESALNIYFSEIQILIIPFDEIFIVERFKGTFRREFGTLTIKLLDFGCKVKSLQVSCLIRRLVYRVSYINATCTRSEYL